MTNTIGKTKEPEHKYMDWVPGVLAISITLMVALSILTPYVMKIPESNLNLIVQAQTTLWNGWLLVLGFYFGTSVQNNTRQAQQLSQQATTMASVLSKVPTMTVAAEDAKVVATPAPEPTTQQATETVTLQPGTNVNVEAVDPNEPKLP